jgi:hypothetical protein
MLSEVPIGERTANDGAASRVRARPGFLLLFRLQADSSLATSFSARGDAEPIPAELAKTYLEQLDFVESRLLGRRYLEGERIRRIALGRIALPKSVDGAGPENADLYLLTHVSGVTLCEVWVSAPAQVFDATRWIEWLDPDSENALPALLQKALRPLLKTPVDEPVFQSYFALSIVRVLDMPLASVLPDRAEEIVRLLFLDSSPRRLKPEVVKEELARDYCGRQGGLILLSRRSGVELHGTDDAFDDERRDLPVKTALPFLITVELLLIELSVLRRLHEQLSDRLPMSIEDLLELRQHILDELEEYYGTVTAVNRFSDAITTDGERLLGITDLYDAVMQRLDAASFAITTRYQQRTTLLQFWLTVVFGAVGIGAIAADVAGWHNPANLAATLVWTAGTAVVSGLLMVAMLWRNLRNS